MISKVRKLEILSLHVELTFLTVLGVDVSKFSFAFDEHTRFIRGIFRASGHAANPNVVLGNEEMVLELQSEYLSL